MSGQDEFVWADPGPEQVRREDVVYTGAAADAIEASAARSFADLDPSEVQALLELQESQNSLLAYAHLAVELGLEPGAAPEDVAARLRALDLTLEEATDWLRACNFDLDCFRQSMFQQLRLARRRVRDRRTKQLTLAAAALTVGWAIFRRTR